jgi:Domain of unknown function (DUF4440)
MNESSPELPSSARQDVLRLNQEYITAVLASDVDWFRKHLATDFVCIESDGSVLDRDAFLMQSADPCDLATYDLDAVDVRLYGAVALVRATGLWIAKAGDKGLSRYVDIYVHDAEGWRVVSAQITRPSQEA